MYATTPKLRLQQYAKHKFGEYKAMEAVCGLTHGTLSYPSEPNVKILQKVFSSCPELNPDWVIMGIGPMERIPEQSKPTVFPSADSEILEELASAVSEPVQPYKGKMKDGMIAVPASLLAALQQQLENKDAQIATLLQLLNSKE